MQLDIGNLDVVLLANLGKDQAQAYAALRDVLEFLLLICRKLALAVLRVALAVKFDLLDNIVEFEVQHACRNFKVMRIVQKIEKRLLQMHAAVLGEFQHHVLFNRLAQRADFLVSEILGEFIVEFRGSHFAQFLDLNFKDRIAARKFLRAVICGEGNLHIKLVAGLLAGQLVFKTGNELAAAELQMMRVGLHAGMFFIVVSRAAIKADDHGVARLRGAARFNDLRRLAHLSKAFKRGIDRFIVGLRNRLFQLRALEIGDLEFGQNFNRHRIGQVLAIIERFNLNLRLHGGLQIFILQNLGRRFIHGKLKNLAHDRLAVTLLQNLKRHLACTEARHADRLADFTEA